MSRLILGVLLGAATAALLVSFIWTRVRPADTRSRPPLEVGPKEETSPVWALDEEGGLEAVLRLHEPEADPSLVVESMGTAIGLKDLQGRLADLTILNAGKEPRTVAFEGASVTLEIAGRRVLTLREAREHGSAGAPLPPKAAFVLDALCPRGPVALQPKKFVTAAVVLPFDDEALRTADALVRIDGVPHSMDRRRVRIADVLAFEAQPALSLSRLVDVRPRSAKNDH